MSQDLPLVFAPLEPGQHRSGPWNRPLIRTQAAPLDRQLMTAHQARSGNTLASRARDIASPAGRQEIVQHWLEATDRVGRPPVPRSPCAPLCRSRIAAAERELHEMIPDRRTRSATGE